jgi:hypothetical protein
VQATRTSLIILLSPQEARTLAESPGRSSADPKALRRIYLELCACCRALGKEVQAYDLFFRVRRGGDKESALSPVAVSAVESTRLGSGLSEETR